MYELQVKVTSHYIKGQPKKWRTIAVNEDPDFLAQMIPKQNKDIFRIVEVRVPEKKPQNNMVKKGFGERLKKVLFEKGLSGYKAADDCGISQTRMYAYLTGVNRPRIFNAEKIAKGLGVSLEYLAGGENDRG